jgi:hypothetical protein
MTSFNVTPRSELRNALWIGVERPSAAYDLDNFMRQPAATYLQTPAALGILREQKHGREKYYINEALFNELAS